jgi:hypothetical protein
MGDNSSTQAMQALQNQWYNAIVTALDLDPNSFQLVEASQPLSNTSQGIWSIFNNIPPLSLTQVFTSSGFNSLYDNYKAVINTILPQGSDQFRIIMGDNLASWNDYKKSLKPGDIKSADGLLELFKTWGILNLDPDVAAKAITIFGQMQNSPVLQAVETANNPEYVDPNNGPKFTKTIQDLRDALLHGQRRSVDFDSTTASSDIEHTWARGNVEGVYDFFFGSAGATYDQLSTKASNSRVQINATFESVVSFTANPQGWFNSSVLNLAYSTPDNTVWPAGQHPTWNNTFGENGNLKRVVSELLVIDGIEATITSEASFSTEEKKEIEANTSIGFWPFFFFGGSGGHTSDVKFNDAGNMTVRISSAKGNPSIFGVNVLPIERMLGHE